MRTLLDKLLGGDVIAALELAFRAGDAQGEVLGHDALLDSLDAGGLEGRGELGQGRVVVELGTVRKAAGPRKDRRDRVGRGLLALLVQAVVARDGAVGSLGLDRLAVGAHEHARHEAERAKALGNHVGHDVAVIVLGRPHESTGALDRVRHQVVDQTVLVVDFVGLKLLLIGPASKIKKKCKKKKKKKNLI